MSDINPLDIVTLAAYASFAQYLISYLKQYCPSLRIVIESHESVLPKFQGLFWGGISHHFFPFFIRWRFFNSSEFHRLSPGLVVSFLPTSLQVAA